MTERSGAAVVVLAAGSGSRTGAAVNKVLMALDGVPVIAWSVRDALATPGVVRVVVVVRDGEQQDLHDALAPHLGDGSVDVVTGGASRQASEHRALAVLADDVGRGAVDVVAIHDGARPLAGRALLAEVLEGARRHGGAVPVVDPGLLLSADGDVVPETLVGMQTPQAFAAAPLLAAYDAAARAGDGADGGADGGAVPATDTAGVVAAYAPTAVRVVAVPGSPRNVKITWPGDLAIASHLLRHP